MEKTKLIFIKAVITEILSLIETKEKFEKVIEEVDHPRQKGADKCDIRFSLNSYLEGDSEHTELIAAKLPEIDVLLSRKIFKEVLDNCLFVIQKQLDKLILHTLATEKIFKPTTIHDEVDFRREVKNFFSSRKKSEHS